MAKRRKKSSAARVVTRTQVIKAPAPIVKVSAPRAPAIYRRARKSVRRRVGIGHSRSVRTLVNPALAGGAVGLVVKSGLLDKLPHIPVIGRIGAGALALNYFGGSSPLLRDMAHGMAFLAGYQLTHDGSISGDDFSTMGFDTMGDEDSEVVLDDGEG